MQKLRKQLHIISTLWFLGAVFYLLITALRQQGVHWWVIFTFSGPSLLIVLILVSLYLFAIYRGVVRNEYTQAEHPLTRAQSYMLLYDVCPVLGTLAALAAITAADDVNQALSIISMGTLFVTFSVWIIIDPAISLIELLLPNSRASRSERIEKHREQKEKQKAENEHLFEHIKIKEQQQLEHWQTNLKDKSDKIVELINSKEHQIDKSIIDIGLYAWQLGGTECMKYLYNSIMEKLGNTPQSKPLLNKIALHWEGIGTWRNKLPT